MKNPWKTAFWILLTILALTIFFSAYTLLDQGVTITHMRESTNGTEHDLERISKNIEGKLTFYDFKEITDGFPELEDSTELNLINVKLVFDTDKKLKRITTEW